MNDTDIKIMWIRRVVLLFLFAFWVLYVPYMAGVYSKKIDVLIEFNERNAVEEYKPCE